jgi:hypothetical protein
MDKLGDSDVACLLLVHPAVLSQLRVLHAVDSEPDTDTEGGSDLTDLELSD